MVRKNAIVSGSRIITSTKLTVISSLSLAERLLHADIEGIVSAVVEAAKGGDMTAARIILDRLVPIRRGRPVKFDLPSGTDIGGIAAAFSALIKSVSEGTLTTEEGASVAVLLEAHRKAVEMVELTERVTALEKANDDDKSSEATNRKS